MLCDLKFVMNFLHQKVIARGALETEITLATVDKMFKAVADCLVLGVRDAQKQWLSVVHDIRFKKVT